MDTSIIVVIAIIVVFVVVVPTMIRKSATELSRVEIDTVPDRAQVVAADPQIPGHDHTERARVFHSSATVEASVPRPAIAPMTEAPKLSLSAKVPEFAVIDGHANSGSTTTDSTSAELDAPHQRATLPVAVGETRSTYLDGDSRHEASASAMADNVRMLHPAVHAVFNQSQQGAGGHGSTGRGSGSSSDLGGHSGTVPIRPGRTNPRSPQRRSDEAVSTGTAETDKRGTQFPNPNFGADEDHSMTEKATTLRESMKSLGTMTRGFGLLFLASALGVLVTSVLAMFSVVHIALAGVFLGLAIVSLAIVRTLNLRRRELKSRLRKIEGRTAKTTTAAPQTNAAPRTKAATRATTSPQAKAAAKPATTSATAGSKAAGSGTAEARSAGSTKAARARAIMERNVSAKQSREEADTGEIPIVRIRNEAAEGHTTRQVLLTGPIPIVEEASPEGTDAGDEETVAAKAGSAETAPAAESASTDRADGSASAAATDTNSADKDDSADSDTDTTAEVVAAASNVDTVKVNDPFMQRLQARGAWSPTPLPIPSYVAAPEAEHPVPEAKAADASSYETEARSREDIAAQFAAELGYRAELSDSAREDSPLEHGRKAIRTNKAPELGAVDDVLARRRA
ncbi:hypothetical protein [Brevibacterium zhoupengii]|uniref:hypothetical protein n=1 Tax=Brevibacterium zhoupengii TaxID=2898795 RepID=UPI001F09351C|nr:hypothetical protein [Brevibacterium zhoupengii]